MCLKNLSRVLFVVIAVMTAGVSFSDIGTETIVWKKIPITVTLNVGAERVIHFPEKVTPWIPDVLAGVVRAEAVGKSIYFTSSSEFEKVRIKVKELETQRHYIIYLSSKRDAKVSSQLIVVNSDDIAERSKQAEESLPERRDDWEARLIRFASQRLYSPERLHRKDAYVSQVPLSRERSYDLLRGQKIKVEPVGAWSAKGFYLAAFKIVNISETEITLDHRKDIKGYWSKSMFQHSVLSPLSVALEKKDGSNVTTLYITSDKPIQEAI